jgi:oligosaccharide translocation protein RFT1
MTMQSLVKHFLTEGDKFVVTQISGLDDQGGYAVASNYGEPIAASVEFWVGKLMDQQAPL